MLVFETILVDLLIILAHLDMHRTVAWKVDMHVVPLSHFCMLFGREVLSHSGYAEK